MSPHALLVIVHAAAATVALVAAIVVFALGRGVRVHAVAILTMTVSLLAAVAVGAGEATGTATAIFAALCVIAVIMAAQAVLAVRRERRAGAADPGCLRAVGFSVIGLLTGFVAVSLSQLTQSPLVLVGAPLLTIGIGRALVEVAVRWRSPSRARSR